MSHYGPTRKWRHVRLESAMRVRADIDRARATPSLSLRRIVKKALAHFLAGLGSREKALLGYGYRGAVFRIVRHSRRTFSHCERSEAA